MVAASSSRPEVNDAGEAMRPDPVLAQSATWREVRLKDPEQATRVAEIGPPGTCTPLWRNPVEYQGSLLSPYRRRPDARRTTAYTNERRPSRPERPASASQSPRWCQERGSGMHDRRSIRIGREEMRPAMTCCVSSRSGIVRQVHHTHKHTAGRRITKK